MERAIKKTRAKLDGVQRTDSGRRRYGREIRDEVVALAGRWRASGRSREELIRKLGMATSTLSKWVSQAPGVVPVRVVARSHDGRDSSGRAVTLVSPTGFRVEGLTVSDAATLLRSLS